MALGMTVGDVAAQQAPGGITSDQIEQLQQLRGGGAVSPSSTSQALQSRETILEPTGPSNFALPTTRLEEILSQRAGTRLRLVGYDQLGIGRPVSLPQVGAVQDSYVLGPGDEIVVSLRGQENAEYRAIVDRDGRVVLPRLNPVLAAGRSFGEFRQDLINAVHRAYVSTEGFVSVGRLRQISVLVSGEVGSPGMRTLTGLSTAVDAVLVSGGVKKTGSLRNVRIIRGGREIPVDLYGVLTGQARASSATLTDGDRIIVPALGRTVAVVGWVRRPGIYELAGGRSAISSHELIALAGGLEVRGKYRMSLMRVAQDGRNQMVPLANGEGTISDSDILFVLPSASETSQTATLSGGTHLAGKYAVTGTKLSQILKSPGALGEDPYTLFGVISRRDPKTLLRVLVPFTPVAVLNGSEDLAMQGDDIVRVLSTKEARLLFAVIKVYRARTTTAQEALINPQLDQLNQSGYPNGGQIPSNGQNGGLAGQNNQAPSGATTNQNTSPILQLEQSDYLRRRQTIMAANPQAEDVAALDMVGQVLQPAPQSRYTAQPFQAQGSQQSQGNQYQGYSVQGVEQGDQAPGYQTQAFPEYQSSDGMSSQGGVPDYQYLGSQNSINQMQGNYRQPNQAPETGLTSNGEIRRFSDLARQLRVDPVVLVRFLNDQVVNVGGAVQGPGEYLIGPDAELQAVLAAAGGLARWADKSSVEVISTAVDASAGKSRTDRRTLSLIDPSQASFIVSPRDELHVNEVFTSVGLGSVTVQGQVRHAGEYQIVRGEHLSDVLMRAGGLTDTAYPYGTVFLRRSVAQREREAFQREAQEIENQLLLAMSRRDPNSKLSPDAFQAMQSYVGQIRNQRPLGRVVVTADPVVLASNPSSDPLLEPGDVVFVPQRPYSVAVLGEVLQPGNIPFRHDMAAGDYIDSAGGYSQFADKSETILVLPDGSARRVERSWFGLNLDSDTVPPGSTIFVARDISGIDLHQIILDTTQIMSQLAVSAASLAVLSKQ